MNMEIEFTPTTEVIHITIGDTTESITLLDFLDHLPSEKVRWEWLLAEARRVKAEKIHNLGNFMQKIIDLTKGEAETRNKMMPLAEAGDLKALKAYSEVIKAYLSEKNTMVEFRHAQKFLTIEEGKIMAMLANLEV